MVGSYVLRRDGFRQGYIERVGDEYAVIRLFSWITGYPTDCEEVMLPSLIVEWEVIRDEREFLAKATAWRHHFSREARRNQQSVAGD
jgi:hypothetical protein